MLIGISFYLTQSRGGTNLFKIKIFYSFLNEFIKLFNECLLEPLAFIDFTRTLQIKNGPKKNPIFIVGFKQISVVVIIALL